MVWANRNSDNKTGLIAAGIIVLKKFDVFLVLAVGALISRVFKKNKHKDVNQQY